MRILLAGLLALAFGAQEPSGVGYDDTPLIPGQKWKVHDKARPSPPVVTPGQPGLPPSDALVLFDGTDLSAWKHGDGQPAAWKVANGAMEVGGGKGDLETKAAFGSCQLHLEWMAPSPAHGESQGRGNSGVFLMGRYEVQVLDSFKNVTYADGQAAALYGQQPPLVNACREPGQWQTYDIYFRAPVFDAKGAVTAPAMVTVVHNGVLVQHAQPILGATAHRAVAEYTAHEARLPLKLQDHGEPVRYRNVWIRNLE